MAVDGGKSPQLVEWSLIDPSHHSWQQIELEPADLFVMSPTPRSPPVVLIKYLSSPVTNICILQGQTKTNYLIFIAVLYTDRAEFMKISGGITYSVKVNVGEAMFQNQIYIYA